MSEYISGGAIKAFRERKNMTQSELADRLGVSNKAVSKWETGRGYPDISLLGPLSEALGVSLGELFAGEKISNANRAANMRRNKLYVCPVCGNVVESIGEVAVSCCGVTLPPMEEEEPDPDHAISVEPVEDEFYVTLDHEMKKDHYISFFLYRTSDRSELVKLYPEGNAECRFFRRGHGEIFACCNRHGLFRVRV